jgi:hypothetical protein
MRRLLPLAAALALGALGAVPAGAQTAPSRFGVGTHVGWTMFRSATGLENAPFLGIDATYNSPINPLGFLPGTDFGLGFTFAASRPVTRGDQFPLVALDFGDTTFLYMVAQRITLLQYGVQAMGGMNFDRFRLYAFGGGGAYTIMPDNRAVLDNDAWTKGMLLAGAGINYAIGQSIGVRLEARDVMFLGWDRERLDATVDYSVDQRIGDVLPPPDPTWKRIQNLQLSLAFSYIPSRRGGPVETEPEVER